MTSINLDIGGHPVRVACTRGLARSLRKALAEHLIDEEAPLGFLVRPRGLRQRRHVLVDRCGFVLGTAARADEVLGMVASHLTALQPVEPGAVRLRLRCLVAGDRATLCAYPLLYVPAFDEARLGHTGHSLVDRLAVDVEVASGRVVGAPLPWPALASSRSAPGHTRLDGVPRDVAQILVVRSDVAAATAAQMAASLAAEAISGDRAEILAAAETLVRGASTRHVDLYAPLDLDPSAGPRAD